VRPNVDQKAGKLGLPHVRIIKTERNRTINLNSMSSSYNTPCSKHKLVVSIYSNTETSLAMSGLAISAPPFNYAIRLKHMVHVKWSKPQDEVFMLWSTGLCYQTPSHSPC